MRKPNPNADRSPAYAGQQSGQISFGINATPMPGSTVSGAPKTHCSTSSESMLSKLVDTRSQRRTPKQITGKVPILRLSVFRCSSSMSAIFACTRNSSSAMFVHTFRDRRRYRIEYHRFQSVPIRRRFHYGQIVHFAPRYWALSVTVSCGHYLVLTNRSSEVPCENATLLGVATFSCCSNTEMTGRFPKAA